MNEPKARGRGAAAAMIVFIAVIAVVAWFLVLNPEKVAERAPEKGQPTMPSR